jgi:hypothetical protein
MPIFDRANIGQKQLVTGLILPCCASNFARLPVTGQTLIELFKSISVLGKWPKNRLSGKVNPNRGNAPHRFLRSGYLQAIIGKVLA